MDTMIATKIDCSEVNAVLVGRGAKARVAWAAAAFGNDMVLLSSMQKTAVVLMHLFADLDLPNEVLFIDTGYHFFETLRLRDWYARRFHLNLVTLYPELSIEEQEARFGKKLFAHADGQPECCRLRKEVPLLKYLASRKTPVLVNGLRRAEGGKRADLEILTPDPRTGGYQLSPLLDWSDGDIHAYAVEHGLPVHPLHERGYPSVGCYPCTTPVGPGEDARAGRWRHLRAAGSDDGPKYCSVNFSDGDGI
jgi:phosphoadenosine phosphosulfate reductase